MTRTLRRIRYSTAATSSTAGRLSTCDRSLRNQKEIRTYGETASEGINKERVSAWGE
jgi:hypothetical protein